MKAQHIRSPQEAKEDLEMKGISVSRWAIENGVSGNLTAAVLRGERKCLRGESHKIAVLLRLKEGVIVDG